MQIPTISLPIRKPSFSAMLLSYIVHPTLKSNTKMNVSVIQEILGVCSLAVSTASSVSSVPISPSRRFLLLSIFISRLSAFIFSLSSSLKTLGLSSIAGPHGARISRTTWFMFGLRVPPRPIRTMSPVRRESLGSETR